MKIREDAAAPLENAFQEVSEGLDLMLSMSAMSDYEFESAKLRAMFSLSVMLDGKRELYGSMLEFYRSDAALEGGDAVNVSETKA